LTTFGGRLRYHLPVSRNWRVCIFAIGVLWAQGSRPGVKTPGVRIPIGNLKPEAVFDVPGNPDWLAIDESVWVSNFPKGTVSRMDPKTNQVAATIDTGKEPCSGLAAGFGSLWVPNCGDRALVRVDLKTGRIQAKIRTTIADSEGGIAIGAGSVWMMIDAKGTLARFDPDTNKPVAHIALPGGSMVPAFGEGSVWVTCPPKGLVTRVDPRTNLVVETIKTRARPRFLTIGEGAVWVLNQGDGSVTRIDPKTNKVVATIEVGVPGDGGDISAGDGSVWVTSFDFPISRIDPSRNRVVQQFAGPGGDAIRAGLGSVWLSNLKQGQVWRIDPRRVMATLP
jgi:virginiamycin B lyase